MTRKATANFYSSSRLCRELSQEENPLFHLATDKFVVYRMAPTLHAPEGKNISKCLWSETLEQLSFAHAAAVLDGLNKN